MNLSKVLIVEDHPASRKILESILRSNYSVFSASSGQEAVDLARRESPDIVLLDVEMPGMDGFQALDILKREVIDSGVPVIFLTARTDVQSKERGLKAGAVDYITKPYDRMELSIKVKNHLALYSARKEIEQRNRVMAVEMQMASQLQRSLLPQEFIESEKLLVSAFYKPFSSAGGDFYDFIELSQSRVGIVQVDVSGHGVASAMIGAMFKMAFQSLAPVTSSPGKMLSLLNDEMYKFLPDSDFLTVFYAIIDTDAHEMLFSNAGHPKPLYFRRDSGRIEELSEGGMLLGAFPGAEYDDGRVKLISGDRLIMYTDGVTEARKEDAHDVYYGEKRLKDAVLNLIDLGPDDFMVSIMNELENFSGRSSFDDDICLVLVEVK